DVSDFFEFVADNGGSNWHQPDATFLDWLRAKPIDWLQQFYALFAREPDTEDELSRLDDARIVKLASGLLGCGSASYFPDEHGRYADIVSCVDPQIYEHGKSKAQQKHARRFLEEVGVKEIGEREL